MFALSGTKLNLLIFPVPYEKNVFEGCSTRPFFNVKLIQYPFLITITFLYPNPIKPSIKALLDVVDVKRVLLVVIRTGHLQAVSQTAYLLLPPFHSIINYYSYVIEIFPHLGG
jgi:hypothetical protein